MNPFALLRKEIMARPGSIVYCELEGLGLTQHSGIYVGTNRIVHLDSSGIIKEVSYKEFTRGITGMLIYVAGHKGDCLASDTIARRALNRVGEKIDYHIMGYNCHQFVANCIDGTRGEKGESLFTTLKLMISDYHNIIIFKWYVLYGCL